MTKKDFEIIENCLYRNKDGELLEKAEDLHRLFVYRFRNIFKKNYINFNCKRFIQGCGLEIDKTTWSTSHCPYCAGCEVVYLQYVEHGTYFCQECEANSNE